MRDDVSAVDVLMMIKGVCEAAGSFAARRPGHRHAPARPGPRRDQRPGRRAPAAGPAADDRGPRARARPTRRARPGLTAGAAAPDRVAVDAATTLAAGRRSRPPPEQRSSALGRRARQARRSAANTVGVVTTPARTPEWKSRLTRSRTASLRRSASKRSRSSPSSCGPVPQVRVLEPGLVGEQRVVHLPEAALGAGRLGGARRRPGARVAGAHREVAEHHLAPAAGQPELVQGGAERALEVGVLDQQRRCRRPAARDRRRRAAGTGAEPSSLTGAAGAQPRQRVEDQVGAGQVAGRRQPDSSTARRRRGRR